MKTIQVDMFAVGLGASVLTQFALEDGNYVTVLADGGMEAKYSPDTVHKTLPEALRSFGDRKQLRIDLIVGTHYDGDHLKGLIPIIEDESIEIGEVWLPPVRKDTEVVPGAMEADEFLAELCFGDGDSARRIIDYLWNKADRVEELQEWENRALTTLRKREHHFREIQISDEEGPPIDPVESLRPRRDALGPDAIQLFLLFFEWHKNAALRRCGSRPIHESATYDSRYLTAQEVLSDSPWDDRVFWLYRNGWDWLLSHYPEQARFLSEGLATIRASEASGAITAIHLKAVVDALRKRKQPIQPRCRFVNDGEPSRYIWSTTRKGFIRRENSSDGDLILTLLGPSEELIEHHCTKLPVVQLVYASVLSREVIPREGITASNQLSYVFTLELAGQRILICGDAGFYKFRKTRSEFHSKLLPPLRPLHVVQIAHHAGRNYDFYHALIASEFEKQKPRAFLLLSHAVHDKYRPSLAFQSFVSRLRRESDEPWLLFTSMPRDSKIHEYSGLIYRAVSAPAEQGDVRLSYHSDGSAWQVDRHAIDIGTPLEPIPQTISVALKRDIKILRPLKFIKDLFAGPKSPE